MIIDLRNVSNRGELVSPDIISLDFWIPRSAGGGGTRILDDCIPAVASFVETIGISYGPQG
jgi:hypothetical protein